MTDLQAEKEALEKQLVQLNEQASNIHVAQHFIKKRIKLVDEQIKATKETASDVLKDVSNGLQ